MTIPIPNHQFFLVSSIICIIRNGDLSYLRSGLKFQACLLLSGLSLCYPALPLWRNVSLLPCLLAAISDIPRFSIIHWHSKIFYLESVALTFTNREGCVSPALHCHCMSLHCMRKFEKYSLGSQCLKWSKARFLLNWIFSLGLWPGQWPAPGPAHLPDRLCTPVHWPGQVTPVCVHTTTTQSHSDTLGENMSASELPVKVCLV